MEYNGKSNVVIDTN